LVVLALAPPALAAPILTAPRKTVLAKTGHVDATLGETAPTGSAPTIALAPVIPLAGATPSLTAPNLLF